MGPPDGCTDGPAKVTATKVTATKATTVAATEGTAAAVKEAKKAAVKEATKEEVKETKKGGGEGGRITGPRTVNSAVTAAMANTTEPR
jgi:hypothetical protein